MLSGLTTLRPIRFTNVTAMPNITVSPYQAVAVKSPLGFMYTKPISFSKVPHILLIFALTMLASSSIWAQVGWNKAYENGLVVSAEGVASEVGRHILQQGGNAVDAAIAVQFALAVTLPRAGNLGGGGFMVVHMADGTVASLDFRERAPGLAHRDMYLDSGGNYLSDLSKTGALAVGVPGTVDGMVNAHARFGSLPWADLVAPAIALAREGYALSYSQASSLNYTGSAFAPFEASRKYFWAPCEKPSVSTNTAKATNLAMASNAAKAANTSTSNVTNTARAKDPGAEAAIMSGKDTEKTSGEACRAFVEGEHFQQSDLARTLEAVAEKGREGFYGGWVADRIVQTMEKYDGLISHEDLKAYESVWREPYEMDFRGYRLHIMPPPSSGSIAVGQILRMMETQELDSLEHHSAAYYHLLAEAMRRAFADRAHYLGDPDFYPVPSKALSESDYAAERMASFDPDRATPSDKIRHGEVSMFKESYETTHFSIIDAQGNAVGITTTLNGSFGSKLAVDGAGFLLNNEMDDFSAQPGTPNMFGLLGGEANAIEPGKRMLSSMTPIIVSKNGQVRMVAGAAGGPRIITATLQNVLNVLLFDMNAQQANAAPRIHHQWYPDRLLFDPMSLSADTQALLRAQGHELGQTNLARVHSIVVDSQGRLTGGVDPRGDGYAAGY
jgi:gamma-glutamyltranspeptidase/glutathione hydrolase